MIINILQRNPVGSQPHPTLKNPTFTDCLDKMKTSFRNGISLQAITEYFIEHMTFEYEWILHWIVQWNSWCDFFPFNKAFHLSSYFLNIFCHIFKHLSLKLTPAPVWHNRKLLAQRAWPPGHRWLWHYLDLNSQSPNDATTIRGPHSCANQRDTSQFWVSVSSCMQKRVDSVLCYPVTAWTEVDALSMIEVNWMTGDQPGEIKRGKNKVQYSHVESHMNNLMTSMYQSKHREDGREQRF